MLHGEGRPCLGLISLVPWCKGSQEQHLLNRVKEASAFSWTLRVQGAEVL